MNQEPAKVPTPEEIDRRLAPMFCPDAAHRAAGGRCWFSWETSRHVRCLAPDENKKAPYNAARYQILPNGAVSRLIVG